MPSYTPHVTHNPMTTQPSTHVLIQTQKDTPAIPMIMSFTGPTRWLSNFHRCPITHHGLVFPAVENAYMAWKTTCPTTRQHLTALSPSEAKKLSQTEAFIATHRPDYTDTTRVRAMLNLSRQKYDAAHNPELAQQLLATGQATLVEGNTWGDEFFGSNLHTGAGQNYLGRILMTVRQELQQTQGIDIIPTTYLPDEMLQ